MSSLIVKVHRISNIERHPNADKLEIVTVGGWNTLIQTGQYSVGDLVVFVPPDSILPQTLIERYQLEYLKKGERVRTVKLRGVISQGLILDTSCLPSGSYRDGMDVAEYLGITKYEVPDRPSYNHRGNQISKKKLNPLFDKYTDIENIKNFQDVLMEGDEVIYTEKLHGTNARFGKLKKKSPDLSTISGWIEWIKIKIFNQTHEFCYGSHNVQKPVGKFETFYDEDFWVEMARKYSLDKMLPPNYIFFGEIIGNGVQDLIYGLKGRDLYIFDIKDTMSGKFLDWRHLCHFCASLGLKTVPVIEQGIFDEKKLASFTSGKSLICPSQIREGVVCRPVRETTSYIGRHIFKSISPEYLLRKNGTEFK